MGSMKKNPNRIQTQEALAQLQLEALQRAQEVFDEMWPLAQKAQENILGHEIEEDDNEWCDLAISLSQKICIQVKKDGFQWPKRWLDSMIRSYG